jgi:hypothetical protein
MIRGPVAQTFELSLYEVGIVLETSLHLCVEIDIGVDFGKEDEFDVLIEIHLLTCLLVDPLDFGDELLD